jgi:pyruvate kinase
MTLATPLDSVGERRATTGSPWRRRAKIVCTLGPATASFERILQLVEAGMDVARLNMSHGTHRDHERVYQLVRQASDLTGRAVAVLADLQGPKIRLATFAEPDGAWLDAGQEWTVTTRDVAGDGSICGTTYAGLPGDVATGDTVLINDGKIRLRVVSTSLTDVRTEVVVGGHVGNHKGINLPGVAVAVPALSPKDVQDLEFALDLGVDCVALSFVRNASDASDVHRVMRSKGVVVPVIAKIEKPQAIENLEGIIAAFDGFMVARGDLGVECPLEDVPILQQCVIDLARLNAKPVIVATQMLESMIENPTPTRAETSDVANAVLNGADAVMLSGETGVGRYPIETVSTMARIVSTTERHALASGHPQNVSEIDWQPKTKGGVVAKAAMEVADRLGARFVVAYTQTGDSARRMSRLRGAIPILAFTPSDSVRSQLALSWGIETFRIEAAEHTDEIVRLVDRVLTDAGRVVEGDLVVVIAGTPPAVSGSTNAIHVHRVGDSVGD